MASRITQLEGGGTIASYIMRQFCMKRFTYQTQIYFLLVAASHESFVMDCNVWVFPFFFSVFPDIAKSVALYSCPQGLLQGGRKGEGFYSKP